jgi:hypothetical protein
MKTEESIKLSKFFDKIIKLLPVNKNNFIFKKIK